MGNSNMVGSHLPWKGPLCSLWTWLSHPVAWAPARKGKAGRVMGGRPTEEQLRSGDGCGHQHSRPGSDRKIWAWLLVFFLRRY